MKERSKRSKAREIALIILYQIELRGDPPPEIIQANRDALEAENGAPDFAFELVDLVLEHQPELDGIIELYAERWALDRMPIIDRNVLRIGLAEMLYRQDIPPSVTINESVELAKEFSNPEESGKFVNGILGRFLSNREKIAE